MTATIPDSARLATPLMQRTLCPACRHYHREAMARRCFCCSEKPDDEAKPTRKRASRARPPKPEPPPPLPPILIPHIWVQATGFGPAMYAGQIYGGDGRPARHKAGGNFRPMPIRLAPLTEAGLEQLAALLQEDISRALSTEKAAT